MPLVAALALLGGCGANAVSPASRRAGAHQTWHEASTPRFVVRTNTSRRQAVRTAQRLERLWFALDDVAFPESGGPSGQLQVTVFADEAQYEAVASKTSGGMYRGAAFPWLDAGQVLLYGALDTESESTVLHEVSHDFVAALYPRAPVWLNEGLAEYHSTLKLVGGEVRLGDAVPRWVDASDLPSLAQLQRLGPREFYLRDDESDAAWRKRTANYYGAWLAVHTMRTRSARVRQAHESYLDALYEGSVTAEQAWATAFDAEKLEELESQLDVARNTTRFTAMAFPCPSHAQAAPTLRTLTPGEAFLHVASTRDWTDEAEAPRIGDEIGAALRLAPESANAHLQQALLLLARSKLAESQAVAEQACELAPEDPETWHVLGRILLTRLASGEDAEGLRVALLRTSKRLRKLAKTAFQFDLLALAAAARGETREATNLASKALAKDSSCAICYLTGAVLIRLAGDEQLAERSLELANNLLPEHQNPEFAFAPARWVESRVAPEKTPIGTGACTTAEESGCVPPKPIAMPLPAYPAAARAAGIQGTVVFRYIIGTDGRVTAAKQIEGPEELGRICWEIMKDWRFEPATKDGKPISITRTARFPFKIEDDSGTNTD